MEFQLRRKPGAEMGRNTQDAGSSEEVTVVTLSREKVCIRGLTF